MLEVSGFGGVYYYAHALCNALTGHNLTVLQLTNREHELTDFERTYDLLDVLDRSRSWLEQWRTIFGTLRDHEIDLLHVQSIITARKDVAPMALMRTRPCRVVYTVHNVLPHDEVERNAPGMVLAHRLIYRSVDALITHTRGDREELVRDFGIRPEKITSIPHGNFDFLTTGPGLSGPEVRQRFGIGSGDLLILAFGAIRRYKGIHLLLQAFARLTSRYPAARLLIVGNRTDPAYAGELDGMIEDLELGDRAFLHGEYIDTADLAGYFEASDCVALPYEHIYDSGVLRLAFSNARPVLATRVGVFAEVIRDGEHGVLTAPEVDDLTAGLERILTSRREDLAGRPDEVEDILADGVARARAIGGPVLEACREAAGLGRGR